jgi:hypothetical protein
MRRRAVIVLTVLLVAFAGVAALSGVPAGALTTDCETGTAPAMPAFSNVFRVRCVIDDTDISTALTFHDYDFASWHVGAARNVTVKTNASTGTIVGASGTFASGDLGRTVTATGVSQTCAGIKARTFISAVSGSTTATLFPKPAKTTAATRSVAGVSTYAGRAFVAITSGSATFTACDVGRKVSSGPGGTAGKTVTTFVNSKLVLLSAASSSSATGTMTLSARNVSLQVANSRARSVVDAVLNNASTTMTSATAKFAAGDVGSNVSGTCIPAGTNISSVTNATTVVMSQAASCTASSANEKTVSIGTAGTGGAGTYSTTRSVNGTVSGGTTFTSAGAGFSASDLRLPLKIGAKVHKIVGVPNANTATISPASTNGAKNNVVIGVPTGTAPVNGEAAANLSTAINLQPTLVAGVDQCATGTYEGATIVAKWYNPGSFVTTGILGAGDPKPNNLIGELLFGTSVTSFAAFVQLSTGDVHESDPHYDVRFPLLPTSIANCPANDIGATFEFFGTTAGAGTLPQGWGQPGSANVRFVPPRTTTATDTATVEIGATPFAGTSCTVDPAFAFTTLAQFEVCGY